MEATAHPELNESAPFYHHYIAQVPTADVLSTLTTQLDDAAPYFTTVTESGSLYRYAPDKWSIRQVLNHLADTERIFAFRALWIARGLTEDLPGFDQDIAVQYADADTISLAAHLEDLHRIRLATISLFNDLPAAAWSRSGMVSGHLVTVRALAYIIAGHVAHHFTILRERYTE